MNELAKALCYIPYHADVNKLDVKCLEYHAGDEDKNIVSKASQVTFCIRVFMKKNVVPTVICHLFLT